MVLTTTDDAQEIKRCYELGCNVYITKPVNYESFANAIRQLGSVLFRHSGTASRHMTPATPPTLLYIDDDAALARLVDRGLTRAGFNVVHAGRRRARASIGCSRAASTSSRSTSTCPASTASKRWSDPGDTQCAAGRVRHGVAGFQHRGHRLEGRRSRLSRQGHPGRFHSAAACRHQSAHLRRRMISAEGPRRGRGRSPRLARPLCGAGRRA